MKKITIALARGTSLLFIQSAAFAQKFAPLTSGSCYRYGRPKYRNGVG